MIPAEIDLNQVLKDLKTQRASLQECLFQVEKAITRLEGKLAKASSGLSEQHREQILAKRRIRMFGK